ncbi:MAG: membrane protein [Flammeovirgaceae bacterium]|jgi:hypothetical protein|nr:DUF3341 domain-containing protein [Bacteroidota bacterium]GIR73060.1 MAG: membrane protein [Flammeovirgaceae bacterium]|tara:strand:- start:1374 stop:1907 length:534 start_codon:yes stop_codon:yes gene_type:complete
MSDKGVKFVIGIYDDEDILLDAISSVRGKGVNIHEVYSPFPVHGIEDRLGYKRSRLSIAAFCFGFLGTCLALTMMIGMMTIDWPMIIGGKDFLPLPVFIPVTFEMTVLLAAFGMVGTFLVVSDLKPWGKPKTFDLRSTDDKHVMAIEIEKNSMSETQLKKLLESNGASETNTKLMEE